VSAGVNVLSITQVNLGPVVAIDKLIERWKVSCQ
jgi:hypothetical protein